MNWYAIRTIPIHKIEFQVLAEINWMKPESAMVPFEIEWEKRRGSKHLRPKKVAVFPCYVFCAFQHEGEFYTVRKSINELAEAKGKKPPIVALLGYGAKPAVLSPTDVSDLKAWSRPDPATVAIHKALQVGGMATITEGPFSGLEVQVMSVSSKKARIKLLKAKLLNMEEIDINPASLVAA